MAVPASSFADRLLAAAPAMPIAWVKNANDVIAVVDHQGNARPADVIALLRGEGALAIDSRVILRGRRGLWDELLHDGRDLTAVLMIGAETIDDALRAGQGTP